MADPSPVLVDQPTGAPTRKTFSGFIAAIVLVFLGKTIPVIWPAVLEPSSPYAPLYSELMTWAPMLIPAIMYQLREWSTPPVVVVPPSNTPTLVQPAPATPTITPTERN